MRSPGFNPHSSAGLSERETRSVAGNHTSVKSEQKKKKNLAERSRLNEEGKKSEQTAVTWRGGDSWPHCRLFAKPISRSGERRYIRKQCCQNNNSTKKKPSCGICSARQRLLICRRPFIFHFLFYGQRLWCIGAFVHTAGPRDRLRNSQSPRLLPLIGEGCEDGSR